MWHAAAAILKSIYYSFLYLVFDIVYRMRLYSLSARNLHVIDLLLLSTIQSRQSPIAFMVLGLLILHLTPPVQHVLAYNFNRSAISTTACSYMFLCVIVTLFLFLYRPILNL